MYDSWIIFEQFAVTWVVISGAFPRVLASDNYPQRKLVRFPYHFTFGWWEEFLFVINKKTDRKCAIRFFSCSWHLNSQSTLRPRLFSSQTQRKRYADNSGAQASKRAFRAPEISLGEVIRREGAMRECCACCKAFGESLYSVLAVIHEGLLFCRLTTLCKLTQETP